MTTLFHATSEHAARSIDQQGQMRCGNHGFAGGGIYFSRSAAGACRKYHNGRGNPDIIIECSVQLGRTLEAGPHTVDRHDVLNRGFDSVKVIGVDVYAVYESRRVRVLSFRRVHCERAFSSMRALLCDDDQGLPWQLHLQREQQATLQREQQARELRMRQLREQEQRRSEQAQWEQQARELRMRQFREQEQRRREQEAAGSCFPASSTVILATGKMKLMQDVKVGDVLWSMAPDGRCVPSEVCAFGHRDLAATATYHVLETFSGESLSLSAEHLVPLRGGGFVPAASVRVGDDVFVRSKHGEIELTQVINVWTRRQEGLIAPFTMEGTLIVDGVVASCYAVIRNHWLAHFALAPARALFRLSPEIAERAHKEMSVGPTGAHAYVAALSALAPLVRLLQL